MIDVINDLDFAESDQLLHYALPMAKRLVKLKQQAKQHAIPVIYVNGILGSGNRTCPNLFSTA